MSDVCRTKKLKVEVQENGIIRGPSGRIIARLVTDCSFEDLPELPTRAPGCHSKSMWEMITGSRRG